MKKNQGKPVSDSAIEDYTYRIFPNDLNANGTVFGGLIMGLLDRLALVIAETHSGCTCVTASLDALHFLAPATCHDHLIFKGSINRVWTSSMEIGLKVLAFNPHNKEKRHIVSAYFTFVALGANQEPTKLDPVIPKTPIQKRRYDEAQIRRKSRFAHKEEIKKRRETS